MDPAAVIAAEEDEGDRVARPKAPEIESGAVEDGMREETLQPVLEEPTQILPVARPTGAELTGAELAEIKVRSDTVDKAAKIAAEAREEAVHAARMHQFGQEALTALITNLIRAKDLDMTLQYRVDLDRGAIVAVGPAQQQR
jgi:hypothetical protein